MAKRVKAERELFEATLQKMINTKPVPLAKVTKSKKKLTTIIEPITPTR